MSEAMTIQMQSETAQSAANGNTEFISFAIGNDQYGVDIMAVRGPSASITVASDAVSRLAAVRS